MIFQVSNLRKSMKSRYQNELLKTLQRTLRKIGFYVRLACPKPQTTPKSIYIAPERDDEQSPFRDAMEIARKSYKVSGTQSFVTVSLVLQRIRSALSVSLSLC